MPEETKGGTRPGGQARILFQWKCTCALDGAVGVGFVIMSLHPMLRAVWPRRAQGGNAAWGRSHVLPGVGLQYACLPGRYATEAGCVTTEDPKHGCAEKEAAVKTNTLKG